MHARTESMMQMPKVLFFLVHDDITVPPAVNQPKDLQSLLLGI